MSQCLTVLFTLFLSSLIDCEQKQKLQIYGLSAINDGTKFLPGGYVIGAQVLAAISINNNSDILSNYEIMFDVLDTRGDKTRALIQSLNFGSTQSLLMDDNSTLLIPFILGPPWSSLSVITAPALSAFNWGQISSAATSVLLSDNSLYPTFYRSIASDGLQSQGIVRLCQQFNWTSIGVVYTNNNFGVYLTNGILELSVPVGIKVNAVSFKNDQPSSYHNAAKTIRQIGVFIIVVIAHVSELHEMFTALDQESLVGFPYFYIGVDSWFDQARIRDANISNISKGFLGTVPWQPTTLDFETYDKHGLGEIYNKAQIAYNELVDSWNNIYSINPNFSTDFKALNSKSPYGWDSFYTLSYALQIFDQRHNIKENLLNMQSADIISELNDILLNHVHFMSMTGNVSYLPNGDRRNGMFAFGNVINDDGEVDYFGYFTDKFAEVQFDRITWGDDFVKHCVIPPRSEKLVIIKIESVNDALFLVVTIVCVISMILAIISGILTFIYRNNSIIKAASWRLNLIVCIGCILGYITIILYGLKATDILCNIRGWLVIIAFTLVFMPLFAKTYRISAIFNGMLNLQPTKIEDIHLLIFVAICVGIDIFILMIFIIIEPDKIQQIYSRNEQIHALEEIQYTYLTCCKSGIVNITFYGIMGLWKIIELVFGIYIVLTVSRIGLKQLKQFNETPNQLKAIIFFFIITALSIMPLITNGSDDNVFYIIITIVTLSVCNVVLAVNLLPRLKAVYYHKEDEYQMTETQIASKFIKKQFKLRSQKTKSRLFSVSKSELEILQPPKMEPTLNTMRSDSDYTTD